MATLAQAAPGDLDRGFGDAGLISKKGIPPVAAVTDLPGARIAAASLQIPGHGNGTILVSQYNADGSVSHAFGDAGRIEVPQPQGFRIDADSEAALQSLAGDQLGLVVEDRLSGDALANLISSAGLESQLSVPFGAIVEPEGKIIYPGPGSIRRVDWSGDPDLGFGVAGTATLPAGAQATRLLAADSGAIYVADSTSGRIVKLDGSGQPSASFGTGGVADVPGLAGADLLDFVVTGSGDLYVLFRPDDANGAEALTKLEASGGLSSGFGQGGVADVHNLNPRRVQPLSDGTAMLLTAISGTYMSAAHLQFNGLLDPAFGDKGYVRVYFGLGDARDDSSLSVDEHDRAILAGAVTRKHGASPSLGIARLNAAPGPDDLDADGILDRRDLCPVGASSRHRGCPMDRRRLQIAASKGGLSGTVRARTAACLHVPLRVTSLNRNRKSVTVRTRVHHGHGTFEVNLRSGHYRLSSPSKVVEERARCSGVHVAAQVKQRH